MHGTWKATSISFNSTNFLKVNGVTENIVGTLRSLICAYYRRGRKGGPKTAKPHRNTPENRKPHRIFCRIPKPRVHVGHNMKADVSKTCDIF